MLKEKLDTRKCFATAWGKLITEEEAYRQLNRQIAAMTANAQKNKRYTGLKLRLQGKVG